MQRSRKWLVLLPYTFLLAVSIKTSTQVIPDAQESIGAKEFQVKNGNFQGRKTTFQGRNATFQGRNATFQRDGSKEVRNYRYYKTGTSASGYADDLKSLTSRVEQNLEDRLTSGHKKDGWKTGTEEDKHLLQALEVCVISSRQQALVMVNEKVVINVTSPGKNTTEDLKSAGLHVVVLSQYDGRVMLTRRFNMLEYGGSIGFPPLIQSIARGRIMIFTVKTEASVNLPRPVRKLLRDMGSMGGHVLTFRGYWAWITISKGSSLGEVLNADIVGLQDFWGSPMKLSIQVPLDPDDCWNASDPLEQRRIRFCHLYDGYGKLCDCQDPAPLVYKKLELENSVIDDVPIGIIASKRPQALYRCLLTILTQKGGSIDRVLVLIDGNDVEMLDLLHLFGIQYRTHDLEGMKFPGPGARISQHYRFSLHTIFTVFPNAPKAIILEEDLLVSPDFFSYFNQTAWLLDVDASLFCISAWNDLGALHLARDPTRLYRVETHAGYGWMLTRQFFNEVYPIWKPEGHSTEYDWDIWFRSKEIRGGRECIVPDVSRTFHNSASGAHIKSLLIQAHFAGHPVTSTSDNVLQGVDRMVQDKYEEDIYSVLENRNVYFLNTTLHPCYKRFIPKNFTLGPLIIFMTLDNQDALSGWKKLGACLGAWQLDTRSHHRGLFRMQFYDTELYIIGYPYSDYSYLKPRWLRETTEIGSQEAEVGEQSLYNRVRFRRPELEKFAPFLQTRMPKVAPKFKGRYAVY